MAVLSAVCVLALLACVAARPHAAATSHKNNARLEAALLQLEFDLSDVFTEEIPTDVLTQIEAEVAAEMSITIGPLPTSGFTGRLAYKYTEPDEPNDRPVNLVVLVNGINTWLYRFQPLTDYLVSHGYRVLTYDHIGFGFSDSGEGMPFNDAFYREVLEDLLVKLGLDTEKKYVIGHSMGGAISLMFTAAHPDTVDKLILMAPAGFQPVPLMARLFSWLANFNRPRQSIARGIASGSGEALLGDFKDDTSAVAISNKYRQLYMWKKQNHVFLTFALTIHNFKALFHGSNNAKAVFQAGVPVHVLLGEDDALLDAKHIISGLTEQYREAGATSRFTTQLYPRTEHCFFMEAQDEVLPEILRLIELKQ